MHDRPLSDFDKTVLEQMEHIRAIGRKRLRNQNELDDFVQETVARAYANRGQLRNPAKLKAVDRRHRAKHRERDEPAPAPADAKSRCRKKDDLPIMPDPHEELERAERNEQITPWR